MTLTAAREWTSQRDLVTRWYGGKHLGGDRFRHVQTCVRAWLEESTG